MARREYEVGGTVYEFPDSFDDAKVKSILTQKGVIKAPVPGMEKLGPLPKAGQPLKDTVQYPPLSAQGQSESMYEAKYGVPPTGHLHEGGLGTILNTMTVAPAIAGNPVGTVASLGTGALAGAGAHKLAKRFGAPDDIANLIGGISGLGATILTAPRAGLLQKGIQQWKNPAVRGALSKIWSKGGMGGWSELETALNPPTVPYPAGKGTGTKYGGAYKPELQVGTQIPRGKFTPPAEPPAEVKPYAPVRPNPNIARKLKSGGSADPYKGRSYRNLPRKVSRVNPTETEAAIEESASAEEASLEGKLRESVEQAKSKKAKSKFYDEEAHKDRVKKMANFMKSSGIDPEMANGATDAEKMDLLKQANVDKFSDMETAWDEVIDEMQGKSWPAKGPTPPIPPSRFEK